jgi:hypothetical protein
VIKKPRGMRPTDKARSRRVDGRRPKLRTPAAMSTFPALPPPPADAVRARLTAAVGARGVQGYATDAAGR